MSKPAVIVDKLSKMYKLSLQVKSSRVFGEVLHDTLMAPIRRLRHLGEKTRPEDDIFWALRGVTFEVQPGEVVGVVGRNGAGKSTLLKVLSRITVPTKGRAEIRGRVGSLLEVGTGFHPELSGRENIFLNGAILGMRRSEILRKFDEIVAFSEIERFLDTPVKRYSSGMYVRLAFAVAAHLEPEILFVDEVLAVGDAAFQKKCLGKMGDVAKTGRTVLFVSHNMDAVSRLCTRGLYLEGGRVTMDASPNDVVKQYLTQIEEEASAVFERTETPSNKDALVRDVAVLDDTGNVRDTFSMGERIHFRITYEMRQTVRSPEVQIVLVNDRQQVIAEPNSRQQKQGAIPGTRGLHRLHCTWESPVLTPKRYFARIDIGDGMRLLDRVENAVTFVVNSSDVFGTGARISPSPAVLSNCTWREVSLVDANDKVIGHRS